MSRASTRNLLGLEVLLTDGVHVYQEGYLAIEILEEDVRQLVEGFEKHMAQKNGMTVEAEAESEADPASALRKSPPPNDILSSKHRFATGS